MIYFRVTSTRRYGVGSGVAWGSPAGLPPPAKKAGSNAAILHGDPQKAADALCDIWLEWEGLKPQVAVHRQRQRHERAAAQAGGAAKL